MPTKTKPPIINCHIHMFTGDYVPPYLAKTYLPCPLYYLFSMAFIIKCLRWYYIKVKPLLFTNRYNSWKRLQYRIRIYFKRHYIIGILKFLIEVYLVACIFFYIGIWLLDISHIYEGTIKQWLVTALLFLKDTGWIVVVPSLFFKLVFFILILIFFKSIRNLVVALLKQFKVLPGNEIAKLYERYVQIGLFSKYQTQNGIFNKLKKQYPPSTQFIGLPMDMEYMEAGKLKKGFNLASQMQGIVDIKQSNPDTFHPFMFADPRRISNDTSYFDYSIGPNGKVILDANCLVKTLLEDEHFAGIKIYPALGYYPFDEALLPLWKYAVDNNLPIMTHCIKGTIFYRGKKKKEWDQHPFFTEGKIKSEQQVDMELDIESDYIEQDDHNCLPLNDIRNMDFCNNFTNPLNYLCLLDEGLLTQVVKSAKDPRIIQLFGYDTDTDTIKHHLKSLKLCFAHFGGDDQWHRFLESDRDNYTSQLLLQPTKGIDFFKNAKGESSLGKLAYIWKYVDWYTIICSIILQYDNVYADISYILHNEMILPLLKQTMTNPKLQTKVLYGSDFYVVRNHKSDKAILADMRAGLTETEFDQIARYNPRDYLNLK